MIISYWAFRGMLTAGILMVLIALFGLYLVLRKRLERQRWFLYLLPLAILLPYVANTSGWLLAEVGRQPWIVQGLMRTEDGVSQVVSTGMVALSLAAFALLYGALMVAAVYLLQKFARKGPAPEDAAPEPAAHQA